MTCNCKLSEVKFSNDMIIRSGAVRVSDPCYDPETWCAGTIDEVKNGKWKGSVIRSDEGEWGIRNAFLLVHHELTPRTYQSSGWEDTSIDVGVDSGQAGIYDLDEFKGGQDNYGEGGWYDDNCDITLERKNPNAPECGSVCGAGVLPDKSGVVSSSGYGDGGYKCYIYKNKLDQVEAIMIDFGLLEEDEEEQEELCEECGTEEQYHDGLCIDCHRERK